VVERQFQVVERQTQVAERRSGPFRLNLTTAKKMSIAFHTLGGKTNVSLRANTNLPSAHG